MAAAAASETLNFNVGVLGHIDSGKTSLARALSTTASTAAFDKNPQSRERGITLDLGFSSFCLPVPEHLKPHGDYTRLQVTLVDCPGHASLIRTIIGDMHLQPYLIFSSTAQEKPPYHASIFQFANCLYQIACKHLLQMFSNQP
eukprot:g38322.t1